MKIVVSGGWSYGNLGDDAEVIFPHDYRQLVAAIQGSEWVLSRRMHGMVIGWLNRLPPPLVVKRSPVRNVGRIWRARSMTPLDR